MDSNPLSTRTPFIQEPEGRHGGGTRVLFLLAAVALVGAGIHASQEVLLPILFGFLFAAAAQPIVMFCERRKVNSAVAVLIALTCMLLIFLAASGTLVFGTLDLAAEMGRYEAAIRATQLDLTRYFGSHGFTRLAVLVQRQKFLEIDESSVGMLVDASVSLIGFTTLAGLVAFFGLLERESLVERMSRDTAMQETWRRITLDTQRYLGIQAVTSAITGVLAALVCVLLDLPNAALWGAIAFWLNFIPVVGSIIASIPPIAVALTTQSVQSAAIVASGYLAINMVFGNIIEPRWQGKAAGMSPLVVILAIAIWGGLLGPLGALLSVPLTMIIKIGCFHTKDLNWLGRLLAYQEPKRSAKSADPPEAEVRDRMSIFS